MTDQTQEDASFLGYAKCFLSEWARSAEGFALIFGFFFASLIAFAFWLGPPVASWVKGEDSAYQVARNMALNPQPMHELSRGYWINQLRGAEGLRIMPATQRVALGCAIIPTYSMGNGLYDVPVYLELSDLGEVRWATILADDPAFDGVCT